MVLLLFSYHERVIARDRHNNDLRTERQRLVFVTDRLVFAVALLYHHVDLALALAIFRHRQIDRTALTDGIGDLNIAVRLPKPEPMFRQKWMFVHL